MTVIAKYDPNEETLDNVIKPIEPGLYASDNGRVMTEFRQVDNEVVFINKERRISWTPNDMRYIDEFGMDDTIYSVQEVPLETKANYARYNRSMPDVDDWFIVENDRLKHQILVQGFQPDPSPWLFGNIDFAIGGKMKFDDDLKIIADGVEHVNPFETNGDIKLYDGDELIFELPQIIAFDSSYDRAMTFGKYRVWFDDNGEMMFDIIISNEWIASLDRVYPIVIDPTVIVKTGLVLNQGSGRFGTKLTNGWLVEVVFNNSDKSLEFYKSVNEGKNWNLLYTHSFQFNQAAPYYSITSKGNYVYLLVTHKSYDGSVIRPLVDLMSFNVENPSGTFIKQEITPSPIAGTGAGCSIIIENNTAHLSFTAFYGSIADVSDIYYVKGSIETNNSVTVTRTDKITVALSGESASEPNLILTNGVLRIVYREISSTTTTSLRMMTFNGTSWGTEKIIISSGVTWPDACFDTTGRIFVSYLNASSKAVVLYSDDAVNFSSVIVTDATKRPSISADYNNKIYLTVNYNGFKQVISENRGVSWSSPRVLGAGTGVPNTMFDPSFNSGVIGTVMDAGSGTINFDAVLLNRSPNAPSNLIRNNYDASDSALYFWTYSDSDPNDPQSAYQLQIINATTGSTVFDSGKVASLLSEHQLNGLTLSNNSQYQWRVKNWDNADSEGPYSDYQTFFTSGKPSVSITNLTDGQIYPINNLTVEWTMSDPESEGQSAYQVKISNPLNEVLFDTGKVIDSRSRARTLNYELLNGTGYKVYLSVWDGKDVKSVEQSLSISVDYTEPATPTLTTSIDDVRGVINIQVAHPVPIAPQPTVVNTDIYRRKQGESSWLRLSPGINDIFIDYTPSSEEVYEYKVRAYGDNQIYTDSEIVSESVKLKSSQIALVSNYSIFVQLIQNPSRSESNNRQRGISQFAGREEPVAEMGENRLKTLNLSFHVTNYLELTTLRKLSDIGENLLYRDNRGRKMFCSINDIQIDDVLPDYYQVKIPITQVSHSEEV